MIGSIVLHASISCMPGASTNGNIEFIHTVRGRVGHFCTIIGE